MKKILLIATAILILLLVLIFAFNSMRRTGQNTTNGVSPTPTTVPINNSANTQLLEIAQSIAPHEENDFSYDYSPQINKMVVTEKTSDGYKAFSDWVTEQGLPELANNPEVVVFQERGASSATGSGIDPSSDSGPTEYDLTVKPFVDFINIFINFGQGASSDIQVTPIPIPTQGGQSSSSPTQQSARANIEMTYYAQCNGYGNIPLPSGCNLCEAGCGPTTVAMIAASYLGDQYNPKTIVDMYRDNNYYLSCDGSRYSDAKAALEKLGLKTTSYMTYSLEKADNVVSDFKKYIDSGWTIFTLANYCDSGCGHYFWVTEIDNGNILAYDPYYGKSSPPPYNENSRYPFPKYRLAFGVKR